MNSVNLSGRLTKDVNLKKVNDKDIANFTIAINRIGSDQADFVNIVVFGEQAKNCEKYLKKGSMCEVEGKLRNNNWVDDKGETHYATDVIANLVYFIGNNKTYEERR